MYDDNDHMFFLLADASLKVVEVGTGVKWIKISYSTNGLSFLLTRVKRA